MCRAEQPAVTIKIHQYTSDLDSNDQKEPKGMWTGKQTYKKGHEMSRPLTEKPYTKSPATLWI